MADGRIVPGAPGVSSFGFSGTNAHVVLEEGPLRGVEQPTQPERPAHIFVVSARTEEALAELVRSTGRHLAQGEESLADACFTSTTGRAHLPHRLACVCASRDELIAQLEDWVDGEPSARSVAGHVRTSTGAEVALLCTGQGAQYVGMARQLYDTQAAFREALDRCAAAVAGELDAPLLDVIFAGADDERLHRTSFAQPANFALEYALAQMWQSWGVRPSAVVGHSLGEFVAVCIAGICEPEAMIRLVALRGRLMESLPPTGAMAAVFVNEERARAIVARAGGLASIAAFNHPEQTVVTGPRHAVEDVMALCTAEGINGEWLRASHGYHSPEMAPIVAPLAAAAAALKYAEPRIAMVSTLTGELVGMADPLDASYWGRQLVAPVRYVDAVERLRGLGYHVFLEVGPTPVLAGMGRICAPEATWLPSLKAGREDWDQVLEALAALHVAGVPVDWESFDRPYPRQRSTLPAYPFARERHWAAEEILGIASRTASPVHPLLGTRVEHAIPTFEQRFSIEEQPVLGEHRIAGGAVVPAPVYVEMALAAAREVMGPGSYAIENLTIREPLVLEDEGETLVHTILPDVEAAEAHVRIASTSRDGAPLAWTTHAQLTVMAADGEQATAPTLEAARASLFRGGGCRGIRRGPARASSGHRSRRDARRDVRG